MQATFSLGQNASQVWCDRIHGGSAVCSCRVSNRVVVYGSIAMQVDQGAENSIAGVACKIEDVANPKALPGTYYSNPGDDLNARGCVGF